MNNYRVVSVLKVRTPADVKEFGPGQVITLPEHLAEPLLAQGKIKAIVPFFDVDGSLIIPFNCDSKYQWWSGGQVASKTEEEIKTWLH